MLIALRIETPSPESRFLAKALGKFGELQILDPWDIRNCTVVYDLAVCVGPVSSCPRAKKRVLFCFGPTKNHLDLKWDIVVATSEKAVGNAMARFGHRATYCCREVPLLEMTAGRRRLMKEKVVSLCLSPQMGVAEVNMCLWGRPSMGQVHFSSMEFNSMCLNGAYGLYVDDDGYDVQVRRHLALGSPVVVPMREGLGSIADKVFTMEEFTNGLPEERVEPIADSVRVEDYEVFVDSIVRSL